MKKMTLILMALIVAALLSMSGCNNTRIKSTLASSASPLPTATAQSYTVKEDVTINPGSGSNWILDGTLTIPEGAKTPYTSVVLVLGSGPVDRDETIDNVNKPFKDIADYLTSKGIAVLRYDKPNYTYPSQVVADIANFTVEDELIKDAVSAANLLKADPRMDKNRVFILGHSEGGMLAPRIDAEGEGFAGIIIMAGSPRNLSDILVDQSEAAVSKLTGSEQTAGQNNVDKLTAALASLKDKSAAEAKIMTIAGLSGYYWKEMNEHPASGYLKNMTKPILIMQGDKDFQVSVDKDYKAYQALLGGRSNVAFKLYPGLNHLFMTSTTGTADEYKLPGHVNSNVLKDISAWILAH